MQIFNIILFISYCFNKTASSFIVKNIKPKISLQMSYSDKENIDYIQKYSKSFQKESTSNLFKNINDGSVDTIYISPNYLEAYEVDNINDELNNYHSVKINPAMVSKLVDKAVDKNVETVFMEKPQNVLSEFGNMLDGTFTLVNNLFLPILGLILIRNIFFPPNGNDPMVSNMPFSPFNNNNKLNKDKIVMQKANISLSSWSGSPEVFEECSEIVSYLKNNTLYKNVGAEIPKGILLEGPPGTGKTLLAKAIASECDANFISVAASEFIELFVGMGASRVRNLFKQAREAKPCIIFIDEIDAVGRQRGAGVNMGNDEREQTLNQLLAEMDGFAENDGILVIAATNRKDVLDKALLRPGRFDRIIKVPVPDRDSRKKILELYLSKKNISDVRVEDLAEVTGGYSGADLKNIVNEAAILAARKGSNVIKKEDIYNSLEKSIIGLIRRNDTRSFETKERVAVHESGHAFLAAYYDEYFNLQKVSTQSTYNGAGGYTIFGEKPEIQEGGLYTKDLLKKRLSIILGGKAAEFIFYGEEQVSLGATQDLKQANSLAQRMIGNFGMGNELEVFYNENLDSDANPFLGRSLSSGSKYSDNTKFIIDKEALKLVVEAYNEAKNILSVNRKLFLTLVHTLNEKSILFNKEVMDIISGPNSVIEFNIE